MATFPKPLALALMGTIALATSHPAKAACTPDPATAPHYSVITCGTTQGGPIDVPGAQVRFVVLPGAQVDFTGDMTFGGNARLEIGEGARLFIEQRLLGDAGGIGRVYNYGTLETGWATQLNGGAYFYNGPTGIVLSGGVAVAFMSRSYFANSVLINDGLIRGFIMGGGNMLFINNGTIDGAVQLYESDNILEIHPTSNQFQVVPNTAPGENNTFRLGGEGNGQFSATAWAIDSWATRMEKTGTSTWTLSGATTLPLTILQGSIQGTASVADLSVVGGRLAPGQDGQGSFTSTGTATLGSAATLVIEVLGTSAGQLVANAVQLGGTLEIVPTNAQAGTYTIIQSPAITGAFSAIQVDGAQWTASTSQTNGALVMTLSPAHLPQALYGSSYASVAGALDGLRATALGDMERILTSLKNLPADQQAHAVASMTPERQAGTPTVMVGQTTLFQGALQNRIAQLGGKPAGTGAPIQLALGGTLLDGLDGTLLHAGQSRWSDRAGSGAWIAPWGGVARQKESGGASGWNASSGGIAVGVDAQMERDVLAGAAFGWGRTNVTYGGAGGGSDNDSFLASLYGAWTPGNSTPGDWTVDASLTGALSRFDTDRKVQAGTDLRTAISDYSGRTVSAALGAKRHFRAGEMEIAPDARLTASRWWLDGYRERGANAADLEVDGRSGNRLRAETGVELAHTFTTEEGRIRPWARLAVGHDWTSGNRALLARFAGTTAGFAVEGKDDDGLRWLPGLGVTMDISENLEASLEYQAELRPDFQAHTGQMALRYKF